MGFLGTLFGSKPKGPDPGWRGEFGYGAMTGYGNSLGANVTYTGKKNKPNVDWRGVGKPVNVADATSQYDFSGTDDAINKYKAGPTSTYNPYQFNFASTPDEVYGNQYKLAESDVARSGKDFLAKTQQAIGTRRPGLLFKAASQNARDTASDLARMRTGLGIEAAKEKTQLGKEQQVAQAGENRGAFDVNQDQILKYLSGLTSASQGKVSQQAQITQEAQGSQDKKLRDLLESYLQAWQIKAGGSKGGGGGLLNTAASVASKFI